MVTDRLLRVDLTDLLIKVDRWTHFSDHFTHAGGSEPRTKNLLQHLDAAILTQACNFSVAEMAEMAALSYQRLAWSTTWYLRDDTLRPAIATLVNFPHRQPLRQRWGGGHALVVGRPALSRVGPVVHGDRIAAVPRLRARADVLHLDVGSVVAVRHEGDPLHGPGCRLRSPRDSRQRD